MVHLSTVWPFQLSLFGLTKTRIAAAAYMAGDDTRASAAVMRPTPWTPPEALHQTPPIPAAVDAGAERMRKEGVRNAVGAADAYAFGIIAWEVKCVFAVEPWARLSINLGTLGRGAKERGKGGALTPACFGVVGGLFNVPIRGGRGTLHCSVFLVRSVESSSPLKRRMLVCDTVSSVLREVSMSAVP